jgi:tripartite-type tricarboxylate transporter receptor subunit TctC
MVLAIAREVNEALRDPDVRQKLTAQYMEPTGTSPDEFAAYREAEMARWTPVLKAANIKLN